MRTQVVGNIKHKYVIYYYMDLEVAFLECALATLYIKFSFSWVVTKQNQSVDQAGTSTYMLEHNRLCCVIPDFFKVCHSLSVYSSTLLNPLQELKCSNQR